jgi:ABC-type branched-subunit amino acid transport system permease subunit
VSHRGAGLYAAPVPTRRSARRHPVARIARWLRPSPELIILTATLISALNALVALDIVRLSGVHLAVVNIGLASVLGIVARGLFPAGPPESFSAECRAQRERGSTS